MSPENPEKQGGNASTGQNARNSQAEKTRNPLISGEGETANRTEYIFCPPGATAPPAPKPTKRKRHRGVQYLTDEEIAALWRAIEAEKNVRDLALFNVAYYRGLRASEVAKLQVAHLRMAVRRIYVTRVKGGNSGEYLLTDREFKALKPWARQRAAIRTGCPALFLSRNGKGIGRSRLDELMKHYGERAGLPKTKQHFHCLRHSCATALLDRDVSIEEVQDHLGHVDIRNTMVYAKITNSKRQRKDERLQSSW